jgi:hypothetical protein
VLLSWILLTDHWQLPYQQFGILLKMRTLNFFQSGLDKALRKVMMTFDQELTMPHT